jgi:hypothetical protein
MKDETTAGAASDDGQPASHRLRLFEPGEIANAHRGLAPRVKSKSGFGDREKKTLVNRHVCDAVVRLIENNVKLIKERRISTAGGAMTSCN